MQRQIELKYKCACMGKEGSFFMRERLNDEDIEDYMNRVIRAVDVAHNNVSPRCRATSVEYLKLPIEGEKIGGAQGGTA